MWLNKFLDVEDDIEKLRENIETNIFSNIKKKKLTPLEFTILEAIFNLKTISGYDLIRVLNEQFAKTWKASSGTVYPILSKLEKNGYLESKKVKSPIGPLKSVYSLTDAGKKLIETKVSDNFVDQLQYIENFLTELSLIYINSSEDNQKDEEAEKVNNLLKDMLSNILKRIPTNMKYPRYCPECGSKINKKGVEFCSYCGTKLLMNE
ncbi:MAG: zinc-ribbon domain-containing protein [Candidatus Lokiarchaeota archaeon]|nr:zinc-ribbon domain-containing protein [Candidatus Lokiarchaeota archaeon]MBD3199079.1 zinc-ribbon domain-containing protein [Candidatus Lokiarchaeota archaeon]